MSMMSAGRRTTARPRLIWLGFYAAVLLAWAGLYLLSRSHPAGPALGALDPAFDAGYWLQLCIAPPGTESLPAVLAMWALMSAAMMLPTALPFFQDYADVAGNRPRTAAAALASLAAGYVTAWLGYAGLAAIAQLWLANRAYLSPHGIVLLPGLTVALLLLAGLYQFSAAKHLCLVKCQQPLPFIFANWRDGPAGAYRLGFRYGAVCIGCCWALMSLAFVGGAMNLLWMGLAAVLMAVEKLPGQRLHIPLGIGLLAAAAAAAIAAWGAA